MVGKKTIERLALEARAVNLDVIFQGNIGDDKLAKRVDDAEAELDKNNQPIEGAQAATDDGHQPQAGATKTPATNSPLLSDGSEGSAQTGAGPVPELTDVVMVTGPKEGRRRIGRRFGPGVVKIPLADLSSDQVTALESDPALFVTWPVAEQT